MKETNARECKKETNAKNQTAKGTKPNRLACALTDFAKNLTGSIVP